MSLDLKKLYSQVLVEPKKTEEGKASNESYASKASTIPSTKAFAPKKEMVRIKVGTRSHQHRIKMLPLRKCQLDVRCLVHWLLHPHDPLTRRFRDGVIHVSNSRVSMFVPSSSMMAEERKQIPVHERLYSYEASRIVQNPFVEIGSKCKALPHVSSALTKLRKEVIIHMAEREYFGHRFYDPATIAGQTHCANVEYTIMLHVDGMDLETGNMYIVQTNPKELSASETIRAQMIMHCTQKPVHVLAYSPEVVSLTDKGPTIDKSNKQSMFTLRTLTRNPDLCTRVLRDFAFVL